LCFGRRCVVYVIAILLANLVPIVALGAEDIAGATIVSVGSCNITIGVNTGNAIITGCNDVDSPDFRRRLLDWFSSTEYGRSLAKQQQQSRQLEALSKQASELNANDAATQKHVDDLFGNVRSLRMQQSREQAHLRDLTASLESAHLEFRNVTVHQQTAFDALEQQVVGNIAQASALSADLADVKVKVDQLQSDVRLLMQEFLAGRFDETLVFAGASVGALLKDRQLAPRYAVEAEWLTPSHKQVALLAELGHVDWTLQSSYDTFAAFPAETYNINRSRTYFDLGFLYIPLREWRDLRLDFGGLAGVSHGVGGSKMTGAGLLRGEWARRTLLVSLDVRADCFPGVPTEKRTFNPLGDAAIHPGMATLIVPSLELRFAMRVR
jgi:hypothetical protein